MTLNTTAAAEAEYTNLCQSRETDQVDFERQVLSSYDSSLTLTSDDDDPETELHLHAVIRRVLDGDRDAADAAYWGFLTTQLESVTEEADNQPID